MCRIVVVLLIVGLFVNTAAALPGSGTQEDPWRIESLVDFDEFADDADYWAGCTRLETDVNLAGRIYTTAVIAPDTDNDYWSYFDGPAFTGSFDGNGKRITNLTIDDGGAGNKYLGFFGYIDEGEVRNLGLEGVSVIGTGSFNGGLVGENYYGSILNCYSTGSASGDDLVGGLMGINWYGSVSNCYSTGDVRGTGWCIGGLMGRNSGSVSNCYSTGDVDGVSHVGGLVGSNYVGSISNCYSTGDVNGVKFVGGLVGKNGDGGVLNCFWDIDTQTHGVTESIGDNRGTATNVAGLPTTLMQTRSTFTDAGWDFIGERHNGTTETWQMPAGGGYPVLSFFHIGIPVPLAGSGTFTDPYLVTDANELGMVSWYPAGCHFKLTGDADLSGIHWSVVVVSVFNGCFDGAGHRVLNMQISGGGHLGLFGHLGASGQVRDLGIEGCNISGGNYIGGLVGVNIGNVKNCYSTGDVDGVSVVGGLVGRNGGSVSDCYSTGDVNGEISIGGLVGGNGGSVSNCYSYGDVSGGYDVGGLVGGNVGNVSNCYSTSSISSIGPVGDDEDEQNFGGLVGYNRGIVSNCYSTCDVTGGAWVGGLVGYNRFGSILNCCSIGSVSGDHDVGGLVGVHIDGSISNSYSTCEVKGISPVGGLVGYNDGDVSNCYYTGDVDGTGNVGGLVGNNYGGSVSNCFWDTDTQTHGVTESIDKNLGTAINVAGLPTTLMQTKSTFTEAGWDFITPVWTIDEGVDYPRLWWERPVLHAEPEVTLGTNNRISWDPVVGSIEYYAECAEDTNFTSVIYSTGWITETSYEFTGLELGQRYWYRVKARNPAGMESQWSNVESSLQCTLAEAIEIVLESINLKSENLKEPYINKINTAQEMIDSGNFTSALNKLENDILQKTDGCAETGEPDKGDWIITCEEQSQIYSLIIETIEHVKALME